MSRKIKSCCNDMNFAIRARDIFVNEVGIVLLQGRVSEYAIGVCPFCHKRIEYTPNITKVTMYQAVRKRFRHDKEYRECLGQSAWIEDPKKLNCYYDGSHNIIQIEYKVEK